MRINFSHIQNIIIIILGIVIIYLLVIFVPRSEKYINYRLNKTVRLFKQGNIPEVVSVYQSIIKKNPDCGSALRGLGICNAMNNDFEQAMYYYQRAVDAGDAGGLGMLALTYIQTDQSERVGELIPGLLEFKLANPRNLRYVLLYALETRDQELFDKALKDVPQNYIDEYEPLSELVTRGRRKFRNDLIRSF
jgi:tetratricopeptide (TPR) repeat protein